MRPLRRRQHPPQLAARPARAGTTRPAAGRPGPATAHRRPAAVRLGADRQPGPGPGPARLVHRLGQARPHPAVIRGHLDARPGQPHPVRGHRQQQIHRTGQRRLLHRDVGEPVQQRRQVLGPGHPHRAGQPPVRAVVPARHHPGHRAVTVPDHRRAAHPRQQRLGGHPPGRRRVFPHRRPGPLADRGQGPGGPAGIVDHRMPRHRHPGPRRHLVRGGQFPGRRRQANIADQHRQVMELIQARHGRLERLSAGQRIHPHPGVLLSGADVVQDMPGGHQHTRRDLETRPHRAAVTIEHPPQIPRHPPVRDAGGGGHDDPADGPGAARPMLPQSAAAARRRPGGDVVAEGDLQARLPGDPGHDHPAGGGELQPELHIHPVRPRRRPRLARSSARSTWPPR